VANRVDGSREEGPGGPGGDRRGEEQLQKELRAVRQEPRERLAGKHLAHAEDQDDERQGCRHPEAPLHVPVLGARTLVLADVPGLERHAALRAAPRGLALHLGVHRAGPHHAGPRRCLGGRRGFTRAVVAPRVGVGVGVLVSVVVHRSSAVGHGPSRRPPAGLTGRRPNDTR
jgi:hypothetical protein